MTFSAKYFIAFTVSLLLHGCSSAQDVVATYYQSNLSEQDQRALLNIRLHLFADSTFSYTIGTDAAVSAAFFGKWRRVENTIYFEKDEHASQGEDEFIIVEVKKKVERSLPKNKKHIVLFDNESRKFFTGMSIGIKGTFSVFWNEPIAISKSESEIEFMFLNLTTQYTFAPDDKSNFYEFFFHVSLKPSYELIKTLPFDRLDVEGEHLLLEGQLIFKRLKR